MKESFFFYNASLTSFSFHVKKIFFLEMCDYYLLLDISCPLSYPKIDYFAIFLPGSKFPDRHNAAYFFRIHKIFFENGFHIE